VKHNSAELWMGRNVKSDCCVPLVPSFPMLQMHIYLKQSTYVLLRVQFELRFGPCICSCTYSLYSSQKCLCKRTKLYQSSTAKSWWSQMLTSRRGRKQDLNSVVPWTYSKYIQGSDSGAQDPYFELGLCWSNKKRTKELVIKLRSWSTRFSTGTSWHSSFNAKSATL